MNNRIRKQEYISSGTFGDVYKVTTVDDEVYAVKKFKNIVEPKTIIKEINFLCRLQNPHVVRIFGCETPNLWKVSMVMEFCPTDLRKAIKQGIIPSRAFRLFVEILKGIYFIHKQNMVHNDLKPENIFLDSKDSIKLGDFGLARYCDRRACNGSAQGSFPYIAPEALQFSPEYSSKTDMYAIAIIAFEMWVKLDSNFQIVILEQLKEDPQRVTYDSLSHVNISPMEYEIIPQLLSKDPERRPSAGDLLVHLNVGNPCSWTPQKQPNAPEWYLAPGFLYIVAICVLGVLLLCWILVTKSRKRSQLNKEPNIFKSEFFKMCF